MLIMAVAASPSFSQTIDEIQTPEIRMTELAAAPKTMQNEFDILKAEKVQTEADLRKRQSIERILAAFDTLYWYLFLLYL